jgi:hypothetical protein
MAAPVPAPTTAQVVAPTSAAWFLVIPAQPLKKNPSTTNTRYLSLAISSSPAVNGQKVFAKVVQGILVVKKKNSP